MSDPFAPFTRLSETTKADLRAILVMLAEGRCVCGTQLLPHEQEEGERVRGECPKCLLIWVYRSEPIEKAYIGWHRTREHEAAIRRSNGGVTTTTQVMMPLHPGVHDQGKK